MKILHVTYHSGCKTSIDFMAASLGHEVVTQFADWNYSIGHDRAVEIWNRHKDFYSQFDVIITSDTAPLSRIFLQNDYPGKLIIWVCNRFDYYDAASKDCEFPDQEYYRLMDTAQSRPNVKVFSYTKFEHEYARKHRAVNWGEETIKPCASRADNQNVTTAFPANINKPNVFFIPPYHNDTHYIDLRVKCNSLGIPSWRGRYNGYVDLKGIKGVIHIPYAWSNLALFENWSVGNVYLIPSKELLLKMSYESNFFWSPPFDRDFIESAEWYLPEYRDLFLYFDTWSHLRDLTTHNNLIAEKREKVLEFSSEHTEKTLSQWKQALENWNL